MQRSYDKIHIEELEVYANHGVLEEETALGQKFLISATLYTNTYPAGTTDDLAQSTDYSKVCQMLCAYTKANPCKLIEAAAEAMCREILWKFPLVEGVTLSLKKPWAPIGLPLKTVSVEITRFWHTAYLGLGSNLGDKAGYLDFAIAQLKNYRDCQVTAVSSYYTTAPYGGVEQDDFCNACLALRTLLPPEALLDRLHTIEQLAHRERLVHWGPRTLDLDILLYEDLVMESDALTIPHRDMLNRSFVLTPLCEIAPNLRHPVTGKTMREHAAGLTE